MNILNISNSISYILIIKTLIEVSILWFVIYHVILFFEGTRAIQVLRGIIILLLCFFLFQKLDFEILDWILRKLFAISVIAVMIIFHPEIRQGLARLGQRYIFSPVLKEEELDYILQQIAKAAEELCKNKVGALIAIEKNDSLSTYVGSGVLIDAVVSADLIQNIFTPNSLLHDGGLVIQHGRIIAAGCLFPLTENQDLSRIYGTRHRAALGLSEEADAAIIVISEERQDISLVYRAKLYKDLSHEEMAYKVKEILKLKKEDA
ncbi:MAG: diadenylate cyclase CdaA [Candidatus Omnitrophica bacterium]|nr:diadenylate cyclase CdaA [Candidatus Omnitrophota bacterium]MDD5592609.1 diadenylate cyclase CdaA [Candidatus Omnitrophota bacterium]